MIAAAANCTRRWASNSRFFRLIAPVDLPSDVLLPAPFPAVDRSEYKKRLKAAQNAKAKAEKEAAKAAKAAAQPAKEKSEEEQEGELDATQYTANRINKILQRKERGEHPYPHKFHVDTQLPKFIEQFASTVADGEVKTDVVVSVAGRLMSKRASGTKLSLIHI